MSTPFTPFLFKSLIGFQWLIIFPLGPKLVSDRLQGF